MYLLNKPLLSICIPTYNRCSDLTRLLDSIIIHNNIELQSGIIEIVVSDNASDDATDELVNKYSSIYKYIRYIKNEVNLGFAANLNSVIEAGVGDYCWLMGSDEVIIPGSIRLIINMLNTNVDIILGNAITHGKERHFLKSSKNLVFDIKSTSDFVTFVRSCSEISSAFAFISTLVVKKKFWDSPCCTEWELAHPYTHMLRLCRATSTQITRILYLDKPLVITGQNINEFNTSIFAHFELDLLTIKYIVKNIFSNREDLLMAYGKIFLDQYRLIEVLKARIECSKGRWDELMPTLEKFGYARLILKKNIFDNLLFIFYKLAKKTKYSARRLLNYR